VWTLALSVAFTTVSTQTRIIAPKNKYKITEDVKVGQEEGSQGPKELPMHH
jgi:hypothetical protein